MKSKTKLSRAELRKSLPGQKKKNKRPRGKPAPTAAAAAAAGPAASPHPAPAMPLAQTPSAAVAASATAAADTLTRLWELVERRRVQPAGRPSHARRLLERGMPYVAQKLGEEAVECLIELIGGDHKAIVGESADVLYHLVAGWVAAGLRPEAVMQELDRRIALSLKTGRDLPTRRPVAMRAKDTSKIP